MKALHTLEKPTPIQAPPERKALAVDVGYGYTKAVHASGKRVSFPSAVAQAAEDLLTGVFGDGTGHRVRIRYLDGRVEKKLVGEAALRSMAVVTTLARQKPADMHDLLVTSAAYLVGAGESSFLPGQIDVAVGLPLAYYRAQKDALADRLRKTFAWVSVDGGEERYISFGRVLVLPQGAGAVAAYPELLPPDGVMGVVDVGQYTIDYLLLEKIPGRAQARPLLEACGSAEVGVHLVHRAVAREFQARAGIPLPPEMWEQAVQARAVVFDGRVIDLADAVEKALSDTAQVISQRVIGMWGNRASFVRTVLLVGGGSLLLRRYLEQCLPCVVVPEDPVYANAAGFLRALTG